MGRKRPRPPSSAQLLVATTATLVIAPITVSYGFQFWGSPFLGVRTNMRFQQSPQQDQPDRVPFSEGAAAPLPRAPAGSQATAIFRGGISSESAIYPLHAVPRRRGGDEESEQDPAYIARERDYDSGGGNTKSEDDPLPKTMEELYERMRLDPPVDPRSLDREKYGSEELEFMEEAFREVFAPTESDAWWDEHSDDWDTMAQDPPAAFLIGKGKAASGRVSAWRMQEYFGEGSLDSDGGGFEAAPFSLSKYKTGMVSTAAAVLPSAAALAEVEGRIRGERTTPAASLAAEMGVAAAGRSRTRVTAGVGGGRVGGSGAAAIVAAELFEQTPFAEYWDLLPDVGVTRRVYAFNAVDRMAALKWMMNCTCSGMHGSVESRQSGHFLWGYADQLDWMRRSGRLSSTPGSIKVDRDSWWGRVSYALTIVPLAAAVECGLWDGNENNARGSGIAILDGYDLQLPEMRRAVRAWRRVWRFEDEDVATRLVKGLPVHDALQERIRRIQWAAHLESLDAVLALYGREFDALPSIAEQEFARGWCRAARLFAVAAAHTNLDKLIFPLGAGFAPERTLTTEDEVVGVDTAADGTCLEGIPYGPPELVTEAESDPETQVKTRRCVSSVRWLGTMRAPAFATLRYLWSRACGSYPARRGAAVALRRACYGSRRAKVTAWGKSILFMLVPDLNYRKLTLPLGVDPAVQADYDPDTEPRDPKRPPPVPRRRGSRPLNPLQWPWYDGRRPDPLLEGGPDEDNDGLIGSQGGGMFPPGVAPPDMSFEALQKIERDIRDDLQRMRDRLAERKRSHSDGDHGSDASDASDASSAGGEEDLGRGGTDEGTADTPAAARRNGTSDSSAIFM